MSEEEEGDGESIARRELDRRVLLGAISLGVKLAMRLEIPLKEVTSLMRVAYMRELRARGLSLMECADMLGVSERTAKNLARELRQSFELPDKEHALPTRIEFMLWRAPMSLARLKQVIQDHSSSEVEDAVKLLLEQERVTLDPAQSVYVTTQSVNSQLSTDWVKRVGGLNSLIDNLTRTITRRFFTPQGEEEELEADLSAFARTLSFYVSRGRLKELQELFWKKVVPEIAALDQASHEEQDAYSVKMTLFWAAEPEEKPDDEQG